MQPRTSLQWWEQTLASPNALTEWLRDQYHGEATAAVRIRAFADEFCDNEGHKRTLDLIATQEGTHAEWIGELLISRGIEPVVLEKKERYWDRTLPGIADFHSGAAVAAHAEHMRLERIRVIAVHPATPDDIRLAFERILPEELFHEKAFSRMAGELALSAALGSHAQGMEALGLVM